MATSLNKDSRTKQDFTPPSGFRDLGVAALRRREHLLGVIREVFKKYGFVPIETPAMERLETLTGQYGAEERLIFKVLRSGDYLKADDKQTTKTDPATLSPVCDKALRYDLTVPLARYVQNHQNELAFPFRRYQIQPVWRGERPQRGRYREFLQCDADIVGSSSLLCEAEILLMVHEVFNGLLFQDFLIRLNHRKLLEGWRAAICPQWSLEAFCILLDKADKKGTAQVKKELSEAAEAQKKPQYKRYLDALFAWGEKNSDFSVLGALEALFKDNEAVQEGVRALKTVETYFQKVGHPTHKMRIDPTLARGLSYYTGTIFEVKALQKNMGSIAAGGRYSHLTERFRLPDMPGVGVSFGIDRISESLAVPGAGHSLSSVLMVHLEQREDPFVPWQILHRLRRKGVAAELYPEATKIKKQFKYAEKKGLRYVLVAEEKKGMFLLKDLVENTQKKYNWEELVAHLKEE